MKQLNFFEIYMLTLLNQERFKFAGFVKTSSQKFMGLTVWEQQDEITFKRFCRKPLKFSAPKPSKESFAEKKSPIGFDVTG